MSCRIPADSQGMRIGHAGDSPSRSRRLWFLVLLLGPAVLYLAGVAVLGDWIVDDAGISYAYARNIALGHGFVSEPGRPPVEGYSNFLWVLALVPFRLLGVFDPVVVPKMLGAACVLWALFLVQRTLRRATGQWEPGLFAALWIACAPPIVIWTASGLENGLMLLLLVQLWATAVERGRHWQARCGLITALAAMTHPEGLIYLAFALGASVAHADTAGHAGALQMEAIADGPSAHDRAPRRSRAALAVRSFASCAAGFLLLFAPFFTFRLITFGQPWPQTYYAKRGPTLFALLADLAREPAAALARVAETGRALAGDAGPWIMAVLPVAIAALAWIGRLRRPIALAAGLWVIAVGGFVVIGADWMEEFRFATGAIVALAITLAGVVFGGAAALLPNDPRRAARAGLGVAGALGLLLISGGGSRLLYFARNPTIAYGDVRDRVAERYVEYGRILGVASPSILTQDVGAVLDHGGLRVYDLGGLTEPAVTRTVLTPSPNRAEFYDWVFEEIRPTFIACRGDLKRISDYERDPRFIRDYAAIESYVEGDIVRHSPNAIRCGDFVRRDALRHASSLDALRSHNRAGSRRANPAWRIVDALNGRAGHAPSVDRLREEAMVALFEWGDHDRMAALYGAVLERRPDDEEALAGMANALDRAGRAYEARPLWMRRRDLERAKGAGADARLLQAIESRLDDARLERGAIYGRAAMH